MNFDFADKINDSLTKYDFSQALGTAETHMSRFPKTDFHEVIGVSLLHHAEEIVNWVNDFYESVSEVSDVKALYFEMDISTPGYWHVKGFAFKVDGGLDLDDMEWLCDVTPETMTEEEFLLTGYEALQEAFEVDGERLSELLTDCRDWCEQIIITRFMELMRSAHRISVERNLPWSRIPIYFTEHDYTFIVKSVN